MHLNAHSRTVYKGFAVERSELVCDPTLWFSSAGSFGSGYYFGDLQCAKEWADDNGTLIGVTLSSKNTLTIMLNDNDLDTYDLDTYALPLIAHLFSLTKAQAAHFFMQQADDLLLGDVIRDRALARGYDTLALYHSDTVFEIVALRPEIITITSVNEDLLRENSHNIVSL